MLSIPRTKAQNIIEWLFEEKQIERNWKQAAFGSVASLCFKIGMQQQSKWICFDCIKGVCYEIVHKIGHP